jgi:hypothetical protein
VTTKENFMPEVFINLSDRTLYGWEFAKAGERIGTMVRALESGETMPPVSVFELEGAYYLDNRIINSSYENASDGGHHRAVAHLLADIPLNATLTTAPEDGLGYEAVQVRDIKIVLPSEVESTEEECLSKRMEKYGEA